MYTFLHQWAKRRRMWAHKPGQHIITAASQVAAARQLWQGEESSSSKMTLNTQQESARVTPGMNHPGCTTPGKKTGRPPLVLWELNPEQPSYQKLKSLGYNTIFLTVRVKLHFTTLRRKQTPSHRGHVKTTSVPSHSRLNQPGTEDAPQQNYVCTEYVKLWFFFLSSNMAYANYLFVLGITTWSRDYLKYKGGDAYITGNHIIWFCFFKDFFTGASAVV